MVDVGGGGGWYSQRLVCFNPTTVMVVLLLGLWLLLGYDNSNFCHKLPGLGQNSDKVYAC